MFDSNVFGDSQSTILPLYLYTDRDGVDRSVPALGPDLPLLVFNGSLFLFMNEC
jgi:hypothetical protein